MKDINLVSLIHAYAVNKDWREFIVETIKNKEFKVGVPYDVEVRIFKGSYKYHNPKLFIDGDKHNEKVENTPAANYFLTILDFSFLNFIFRFVIFFFS